MAARRSDGRRARPFRARKAGRAGLWGAFCRREGQAAAAEVKNGPDKECVGKAESRTAVGQTGMVTAQPMAER